MDVDAVKVVHEAQVFSALEAHPGWLLVLSLLDTMVNDASKQLREVKPTEIEAVVAAHRDWRAVSDVKDNILEYIVKTKEAATEILAVAKDTQDADRDTRNAAN